MGGFLLKYKREAGNRGYGLGDGGGGGGDGGDEAPPPKKPRLPLAPPPKSSTSRDPTALPTSRSSLRPRRRGASRAGTSSGGRGRGGGGGSGGDERAAPLRPPRIPLAPPPTSSTSRDPTALPTSRPTLQRLRRGPRPPRRPAADKDTDEEPDNGDPREEENDEVEADKEPLLALVQENSNHTIVEKIKILRLRYAYFRRTREDSSCFYKAFLFSYLENLGQLQDRQAEVTRLMGHVDRSKESFCGLNWDQAYLSNPQEYFSSVMAEFIPLVNAVANGLSSDDLLKICSQAIRSPRIISLLRLLAETDIRTGGDGYETLRPDTFDALPYCRKEVRRMDAEVQVLVIRALTYALGIPLRVEAVDTVLKDRIAKVKRIDYFPRSESGKGPFRLFPSYWSSITPPTPQEMGSGNLLSFDRTPLLTLMCMRNPRRWYILYRE